MENSKIQWTDHTFNPWWGCSKISPGCKHCYAEKWADERFHLNVWGAGAERRVASETMWAKPTKWNATAAKAGKRARVFCASMADVFEDYKGPNQGEVQEARKRLMRIIEDTPHLDWLLLTKRPENAARMVPKSWGTKWPRNAWVGCTVEDRNQAEERLPHLLELPSSVKFVSYEPALEWVDFKPWVSQVNWIIVGGESGPGARPFDPAWAEGVVSLCRAAQTPVFVKQFGANPTLRSGSGWGPVTATKGDDMAEWPEQLRVREFPEGQPYDAIQRNIRG
jgi:protein gp37